MYPLGHFLLAALPLSVYSGIRYRRLPRGHTLLLVIVATQLPDMIDKPLAWTFGVIPSGRMLAHSLVISLPLLTLGCLFLARYGAGRFGALFSVAYLSHIVGDFYPILWAGTEYYFFPNLFWPFASPGPKLVRPGWAGPELLFVHLWTVFSIAVLLLAGLLLIRDVARQSGFDGGFPRR